MGEPEPFDLPTCAQQFIAEVVRQIRYRRRVRDEVRQELAAHFEDELRDCADALEREKRARRIIGDFGDAKLLAILCRRAKKRCRPLWVRAWARMMQAVGVFLVVFIPYTIWFISGKPNPTIDYVAKLNSLHGPVGPAKDDAWAYYERAMRLFVEPNQAAQQTRWFKSVKPPEEPLTPQGRKVIEDWIATNSLAWLQLEFAAARGHCHRVYHCPRGAPLLSHSSDDPPIANLRRLAQLGLWKARLSVEQGHIDEALDYRLTLFRVGAHWEMNPLLIDQLIGRAIHGLACQELLRTIAVTDLSDFQLSDLQARLLQTHRDGYPFVDFDGERLLVLDAVQCCFTDGGLGGGHRVSSGYVADLKAAPQLLDEDLPAIPDAIAIPVGVGLSMFHASRNKTVARIDQIYARLREISRLSPYERRIRGVADLGKTVGTAEMWRYALVYTLLPAERRVSELAFRARADYEGLLTVIAVKRYHLEKGSHPPDLETLVHNEYLDKLPMDPYSGAPLVYRPTTDGFTLYSVGPNFADDGGEPGRDKDGLLKPWRNNGDRVFWPVGP
jgi:hypothetical protein